MKPKVVKNPRPVAFPSTTANRKLSTMEKATSWVDKHGMINVEKGIERVFRAAIEGGVFTVCTKGSRPGEIERLEYRSFPEAARVYIHYMINDRNPMLYAATYNRDALIAASGYKDKSTGKYVPRCDATADLFQHFLNIWCQAKGIKNHPRAPILEKLRTPKRKIKRERL